MFQDPLDCIPYFADFNVSAIKDPSFRSRADQQELLCLVYRSRRGDQQALDALADTFYWTVSKRAAEMFERVHSHRPIQYSEWFYAKLDQLLGILLYESVSFYRLDGNDVISCRIENPEEERGCFSSGGPILDHGAIKATFRPEDLDKINWHELVSTVSAAKDPAERNSKLVAWTKAYRRVWKLASLPESGWRKNAGRDEVILSGLELELKRERICADLDRRRIAVNLPALTARGFRTWADGWDDPEGYRAIQRLFSKLVPRLDPVKSFVLSE